MLSNVYLCEASRACIDHIEMAVKGSEDEMRHRLLTATAAAAAASSATTSVMLIVVKGVLCGKAIATSTAAATATASVASAAPAASDGRAPRRERLQVKYKYGREDTAVCTQREGGDLRASPPLQHVYNPGDGRYNDLNGTVGAYALCEGDALCAEP